MLRTSAVDNIYHDLEMGVLAALAPNIPRTEEPYFWAAASHLAHARDGDAKGELPRQYWPTMVRFRDLDDLYSLEQVNPASIGISRIVVETTRDPISIGIEGTMPGWFRDYYDGGGTFRVDTSNVVSPDKLEDDLRIDSFSTEIGR